MKNTFQVGKSLEEMKAALDGKAERYDVVFSNPPYQVNDGGGTGSSAVPIYHEIVMYVIDHLKPHYVCMITPSRWMAGGKGLDDYRDRMIHDKRLRLIQDFPGNTEVFETVSIQGGVSYFLWDRDYNSLCEWSAANGGILRDLGEFDVVVRNNMSAQIVIKIKASHKGSFCDEKVLSLNPFGVRSDFGAWIEEITNSVKCVMSGKKDKRIRIEDCSDEHSVMGKWKVVVSKATIEGSTYTGDARKLLMSLQILPPATICTETYLVVGSFGSKGEAENFASYVKTKFYRFMLSLRVISQNMSRKKFSFVPDLGNYSKAWTDEELYKHFNLTIKEIEHIEKSIKAF